MTTGITSYRTGGEPHVFEVHVYLDDLDPEVVRIKLYANGVNGSTPECVEMQRVRQLAVATNGYAYRSSVSAARPASDYTARLITHRHGVAAPLETTHILFQR